MLDIIAGVWKYDIGWRIMWEAVAGIASGWESCAWMKRAEVVWKRAAHGK